MKPVEQWCRGWCVAASLALPLLWGSFALGQGQDFTWVASGGGTFAEPSNWDMGAVPGVFDRSIFDLNSIYAVRLDQDAQNQHVLLHAGQVTIDLDGFTFRNYIQESGGSERRLVVGEVSGNDADFTITGGIWERVGDALIARDAGSAGTLTITGASAGFTGFEGGPSEGRIRVGQFGDGTLFLLDGARLEFSSAPSGIEQPGGCQSPEKPLGAMNPRLLKPDVRILFKPPRGGG